RVSVLAPRFRLGLLTAGPLAVGLAWMRALGDGKKKAEPLLTLPGKHFLVKLENDTYADLNNAACKLNVLRIRESRAFDAGILREEVRQVSSVVVSAVDSVTGVRVIQHVECLAAKLNGQVLHHLDVFEEPHVQLVELRSAQ